MDSAEQAPDSGKKHCVQVSSEQTGQKMLSFLQRLLPDVPASALHRALRRGEVRLNSKRCKPFTRVSYGDEIRIPPFSSRPTQSADTVLPAPIDILHTTPDFFIVHKPAGLPVHGGSGSPDSVITSIRRMFPNESFQSTPVHRLDKHTSGLLLIARSYTFLRHMHCLWQTRKVKKHYLAWVDGNWPDSKEVCLTDELARRSKNGREKMETGQGKSAWCYVQCIRRAPDTSLLKIRLGSGRTHQIRVQLSTRGFPVTGDTKYGQSHTSGRMFLHALSLEWETWYFTCPPDWPVPYTVCFR